MKKNVSILHINNNGYSAFHEATIWGHLPIMKLLLEKGGVSPNFTNSDNNTALHLCASQKGNSLSHIKYLCEIAEISPKNNKNETPLHLAGCPEYAEILVKSGADLHTEDINGNTPLMTALLRENYSVAAYLGDNGANTVNLNQDTLLGKNTKNRQTILHKVAEWPNFLKILLQNNQLIRSMINEQDDRGNTPLHIACKIDSVDAVITLLEHDASITTHNADNETPFEVAAKNCSIYSVVYMLEKKLVPDNTNIVELLNFVSDEEGITLLQKAVSSEYLHGVQILAENGAKAEVYESDEDNL